MKHRAYLALGTNVGNRQDNLVVAIRFLEEAHIHVIGKSRVFETEPVGYKDQDWFLNQVIQVKTTFSPGKLLYTLARIEKKTGRKATFKWGPRVMDIDIIFYDDRVIQGGNLKIPHPHYRERRFVLEPLQDIDPALKDPETGETMADLLNRCSDKAIVRPLF